MSEFSMLLILASPRLVIGALATSGDPAAIFPGSVIPTWIKLAAR